ncbi:hypothetical protein PG993_012332 [Apiospora rasikravindrae]|uniref:Uncharacterized protein n=1 Tax=Apiospora rasikravindrae TaxID=990691 RepID=A0ABR1S234_9PEZI
MTVDGKEKVKSPRRNTPPAEETRYNALIAKLNRRGTSDSVEDVALSHHSKPSGQCGPGDAAVPRAGSTLNPKATEFTLTEFPKQHPATFSEPSAAKAGRPSILNFFESAKESPQIHDLNPKAIDDLRAWGRVFLDLLDAISHDDGQKEKLMSSLGDGVFPPGLGLLPPPVLQPNSTNLQLPPSEWPICQDTQLPLGIQPIAGFENFMPSIPTGLYNDINAYLLAARDIPLPAQPLGNARGHTAGLPASIGLQTNLQPNAPLVPQPGMAQFPIGQAPMQATNRQAPNLPPQPGLASAQNNGAPRTTAYPHGFGPTPVSKPKGPARRDDPRWCKQQMMYEAYLEWQRSTDTNYHKKCKDRQAKRAERQRASKDRQNTEVVRHSSEGAVEASA